MKLKVKAWEMPGFYKNFSCISQGSVLDVTVCVHGVGNNSAVQPTSCRGGLTGRTGSVSR